jgi:polysaccharide biosynthesis/export protein
VDVARMLLYPNLRARPGAKSKVVKTWRDAGTLAKISERRVKPSVSRRLCVCRLFPIFAWWYLLASSLSCCNPLPDVPHTLPPPVDSAQPYRLQPGDQFDVKFFKNPDLNESVMVQPDGRFSLSLAQNLSAAGLTLDQVRAEIEQSYHSQLYDCSAAVILRTSLPARIYVGGEVNSPGEYLEIGPPLTLVQAIARAGGLKNSANADQIILARRGTDGVPVLYSLSFNNATTGVNPPDDVPLQPYDSVFVPRTPVANTYLAFQQYIQQFVPISFGYSLSATTPAIP